MATATATKETWYLRFLCRCWLCTDQIIGIGWTVEAKTEQGGYILSRNEGLGIIENNDRHENVIRWMMRNTSTRIIRQRIAEQFEEFVIRGEAG